MKKITVVATAAVLLFSAATVASAGGYRHYPRYHGHRVHHHVHGNHFWWGLGFGVLTGALAAGLYYSPPPAPVYYTPPPPPPVYYAPAAVVVQPAPVVVQQPHYRSYATRRNVQAVRASVSLLNVRGGPGLDQPVVTTVRGGEPLEVMGSAPDWFYVRTSAGVHGWVMSRFTLPEYPQG